MEYKQTFICQNEQETIKFGKKLARFARKGDVFLLFGTLGMGKTTLSRAFIQELTEAREVPSPTFTLLQTYETPDFDVYHFDLYRIKSAEEIFEIGVEEAMYEGVSLIEWPEKMEGYQPRSAFRVTIRPEGENGRQIEISTTDSLKKQRLEKLGEV
ncbi:MAG: tRNA (adenosine(37)-N6)-threonylcarbamoyltransferase complex ATPase subunit type 1 TsaE [Alphaproteobacteria bacterium]|nr:tRNA (adenosine(37)-N6)-threonylcarbamoyltransferase complex ATPase subunit type 1 TsaE [Alphaproteobacteria bacterium]